MRFFCGEKLEKIDRCTHTSMTQLMLTLGFLSYRMKIAGRSLLPQFNIFWRKNMKKMILLASILAFSVVAHAEDDKNLAEKTGDVVGGTVGGTAGAAGGAVTGTAKGTAEGAKAGNEVVPVVGGVVGGAAGAVGGLVKGTGEGAVEGAKKGSGND